MQSMTGFGCGEVVSGGWKINCAIKSVNHRNFSLHINLPSDYIRLENKLRSIIKNEMQRGRIDVFLRMERDEAANPDIAVDQQLFNAYRQQLAPLLDSGEKLSVEFLLALPGVLLSPEKPALDQVEALIIEAFNQAMTDLISMQQQEGLNLKKVLLKLVDQLETTMNYFFQHCETLRMQYFLKIKKKIATLLQDTAFDEDRLLLEAAVLAEKGDIAEEIARLESHTLQLKKELNANYSQGKKLDFIAQEMQRELNTMAAKTDNSEVIVKIIDLKSVVEKIREQVQNIS